LKEFFIQLFISSQVSTPIISSIQKDSPATRDRTAVEVIFKKVVRIEVLAMGMVYFISEAFRDCNGDELVKWAAGIAKETLRTGVDV